MTRVLVALLWFASLGPLSAAFNPFAGPAPVAVLIQTDPWATVVGSDTPRVAVYEGGTVIFVKSSSKTASYHRVDLSDKELAEFKEQLKPAFYLKKPKPVYDLMPAKTDRPEAQIYVRDGGRILATRIIGLEAGKTGNTTGRKGDTAPEELLQLHRLLATFDHTNSQVWSPEFVELMVWPFQNARGPNVAWPRHWPTLKSERALKRGPDSYSVFLDGDQVPQVRRFMAAIRKENSAAELEGRKWAVSFRSVFAGEPIWRKALEPPPGK